MGPAATTFSLAGHFRYLGLQGQGGPGRHTAASLRGEVGQVSLWPFFIHSAKLLLYVQVSFYPVVFHCKARAILLTDVSPHKFNSENKIEKERNETERRQEKRKGFLLGCPVNTRHIQAFRVPRDLGV